jgi:DNA repair protein RecO (recombination protein O)
VARPKREVREAHTQALVLRAVPLREADVLVTLLTHTEGLVSALAPSARRPGSKRLAALEPVHLLQVTLELPRSGVGGRVREAAVERTRLGVLGSLEALESVGGVLRWLRRVLPEGPVDEDVWVEANRALDELDELGRATDPAAAAAGARGVEAAHALRVLTLLGVGLELTSCVRCGRAAPERAPTYVDPGAGGVVCSACGGGPWLVRAPDRAALRQAQASETETREPAGLDPRQARLAAELADAAARHHLERR